MAVKFPNLVEGQKIEVYLRDGEIVEGRFQKWLLLEELLFILVAINENLENNSYYQESCYLNNESINLIYPL